MKIRISKKIILIIVTMIVVFNIFMISKVNAVYELNVNTITHVPQGSDVLVQKANVILGIIQVVGSIISVVALAVIGIKYMLGSVQEKADYKKTLGPYIIGAILLFASCNLVKIIYSWSSKLTP